MFKLSGSKMKALTAALMLTLAVGMAGCGGGDKKPAPKAEKKFNVGIVQLVEHAALDAANKGFVDGLAKKGFTEGKNITFDRQNAQADQSNLQNIANRFVNNKVDLICAIATPSAQSVANATKEIPIVGTAITDYKSAKLVKDPAKPGTATVSTVNDIQQAAHSLIGKVDALYIPTDNIMASAMPTLCKVTDEAKLAVICAEPGEVKAGGLITLGIDYYMLGEETGAMAAEILNGKAKPQDMAIRSQKTPGYGHPFPEAVQGCC